MRRPCGRDFRVFGMKGKQHEAGYYLQAQKYQKWFLN
jgi:hypothetical protein